MKKLLNLKLLLVLIAFGPLGAVAMENPQQPQKTGFYQYVRNLAISLGLIKEEEPLREADIPSVLFGAIKFNKTNEIASLIKRMPAIVNARLADNRTPLMWAAFFGQTAIVEMLLAAGADSNLKDGSGNTGLMIAIIEGHSELAEKLIDADANLDLQNNNGDSALIIAARLGYADLVKELLSASANIQLRNHNGKSALDSAKDKGNAEIVQLLSKQKLI